MVLHPFVVQGALSQNSKRVIYFKPRGGGWALAQRPFGASWGPAFPPLGCDSAAELPASFELIHKLPGKAVTTSLFQKKKRKPECIYFYCIKSVIDLETKWRKRNSFCDRGARPPYHKNSVLKLSVERKITTGNVNSRGW